MLYISGRASSTTIKNKTLARVKTMENTYDTEREEIRIKKNQQPRMYLMTPVL